MSTLPKFTTIDRPYLYGKEAELESGLRVEVVRCYEGEWNVFITENDHVVARSVAEYRACKDGYLPKDEAFRIARELLNELVS